MQGEEYNSMKYSFSITGRIKPKERPRRGRGGHFYTPKATIDCEGIVALEARQGGLKPISGPLAIEAHFFGNYGTCDLDNLIKTLLDGLKLYFNDRQVIDIVAKKTQYKEHLTQVTIQSVNA